MPAELGSPGMQSPSSTTVVGDNVKCQRGYTLLDTASHPRLLERGRRLSVTAGIAAAILTAWLLLIRPRSMASVVARAENPAYIMEVACSAEGDLCLETGCCSNPDMTCYIKHSKWASCRKECTPGIDDSEPAEYQTPWSCLVVGNITTTALRTTTPAPLREALVQHCDYSAAIEGSNECRDGSTTMEEHECRSMPTRFGGELNEPFILDSGHDPKGCFKLNSLGLWYFNKHASGASFAGRSPYCKRCSSGAV